MEGLFEIHVSVDTKDIMLFRLWALDNDVKAIGIIGDVPELTFSKYTNGTHEKAHNKAMSLARNLTLSGIRVVRVRVEAVLSSQNPLIDAYAENTVNKKDTYFEFHIKYHIINSKDYYQLDKIAKDFTNEYKHISATGVKESGIYVFVGFNSFKKNIEPIVTLRVPAKHKTIGSFAYKDLLMNVLKKHGFRTNEEIHREYVFVDEEYTVNEVDYKTAKL